MVNSSTKKKENVDYSPAWMEFVNTCSRKLKKHIPSLLNTYGKLVTSVTCYYHFNLSIIYSWSQSRAWATC